MDADLLLAWMSETGSGDIDNLRSRITWLARNSDVNPKKYEVGRWMRELSALGHVELDWNSGRWAIAPPAAVLLPVSGGTVALTGLRRKGLIELLSETVAVHIERPNQTEGQLAPVSTILLQADSFGELISAVRSVGVSYVGNAAEKNADRLPPISLKTAAGPPARNDRVEKLSTDGALRFVTSRPSGNGLYKIANYKKPIYRFYKMGRWYQCDFPTGVMFDRLEKGLKGFRFVRDRVSGDEEIGRLITDPGVQLPVLQARALYLCSAVPPEVSRVTGDSIFYNVPRSVAISVSKSVHQTLED
ncbi:MULTISPECIES: hypothetical protein [unclassified Dietzia]|uniref:hypothetical protein n=1 Tax=unclassified Dietzia TaxID=2617939 RepID=UPI0015FABF43|nr:MULTISPECIES: hypothetical protein [unclassified Dietzia]MBB1039826.1 hypothetical protein [Dietzia sp. Cai40]MBB1045047.1 hypothetical protein [Dietzia sp. DQ11-44]